MPIHSDQLLSLLTESFPKAIIEVVDLAGDFDHYRVRIGDPIFKGKTRIEQHKMVYDVLKGVIGDKIHAFSLETYVL